MRPLLSLFTLVFPFSLVCAQQISNVTITPGTVRACEQFTFHVLGTGGPGMSIVFINNNITTNSITLVLETSAGAGSSPFNLSVGPYGPFNEGTYALSISLEYNDNITTTWTGSLTVEPGVDHDMGESNSIIVCPNDDPFQLFSQLNGTPEDGGVWLSPQLQEVPGGTFIPGTSTAGDYLYYFPVLAPCTPEYQYLTIQYNENTTAGTDSAVTLCTVPGAPSVDLFPYLGPTAPTGGTWTGPVGSTDGTFTPGTSDLGEYVYEVIGIAPCTNPTATVTVAGAPASDPGVGDSAVFCFDETEAYLSEYVTGEDEGGIWLIPTGEGITLFGQPVDVSLFGEGNYGYVANNMVCPADTSYVYVTLDGPPCTLGIPGQEGNNGSVLLMPNPANHTVVVELERTKPSGVAALEVCDVNGKVVLRKVVEGTGRLVRETIDISKLAPGAYLVRLSGTEGFPAQRLMVR